MLSKSAKALKWGGLTVGAGAVVKLTLADDWDIAIYRSKKFLASLAMKGHDTKPESRVKPKVVVLGTGWGALSFIRNLDDEDIDLTIVSPRSFFFYTPLLAGSCTGTVSYASIIEPIRWYFNRSGLNRATFLQANCDKINLAEKTLSCTDIRGQSLELAYDAIVIAVGAEPATFGIPGVKEHATFMKEIEDGIKIHRALLDCLEKASSALAEMERDENKALLQPVLNEKRDAQTRTIERLLHWVVIGGGPTGVELSAEIMDFVAKDVTQSFPLLAGKIKVTLVEASGRVLGAFDKRMSEIATAALNSRGAQVRCSTVVTGVTPTSVEVKTSEAAPPASFTSTKVQGSDVESIPYGVLVWAGGITARPLIKDAAARIGPDHQTSRSGLTVGEKLQVCTQ